jgi:AcrR family transcriptional regulator
MKLSERRTLKMKEQILLTAIKTVNRRGYEGATMEEIAADLLMTKGSLYYYFKSKADLMYQCHNLVLSKVISEMEVLLQKEGSAEEIIREMIAKHIDYAIEEKETFNMIIEPKNIFDEEQLAEILKLRKVYSELFDRIIKRGVTSREFTVDETHLARMVVLGALNWIQQWYRTDGRLTKEELINSYQNYLLKLLK